MKVEVDINGPETSLESLSVLPEITATTSDGGQTVEYVREASSDLSILGILAHCRRSIETRYKPTEDSTSSYYERVLTHLTKASNYLESEVQLQQAADELNSAPAEVA